MWKRDIVYTCDVCGNTRKGNGSGVTCKFCGKFMLNTCGCYGTLVIARKCCGKEGDA